MYFCGTCAAAKFCGKKIFLFFLTSQFNFTHSHLSQENEKLKKMSFGHSIGHGISCIFVAHVPQKNSVAKNYFHFFWTSQFDSKPIHLSRKK